MKKKQFMSKLAALTMAAAMGLTAVPATAVFAAETSVEASDTVISDTKYVAVVKTFNDKGKASTASALQSALVPKSGQIDGSTYWDDATKDYKTNTGTSKKYTADDVATAINTLTAKGKTGLASDFTVDASTVSFTDADHFTFKLVNAADPQEVYTATISIDKVKIADSVKNALDNYFNVHEFEVSKDTRITNGFIAAQLTAQQKDTTDTGADKAKEWDSTTFPDTTVTFSGNTDELTVSDGKVSGKLTVKEITADLDSSGNKANDTFTYDFTANVKVSDQTEDEAAAAAVAKVNGMTFPTYSTAVGYKESGKTTEVKHDRTAVENLLKKALKDAGYPNADSITLTESDYDSATATSDGYWKGTITGTLYALNVKLTNGSDQKSADTQKSILKVLKGTSADANGSDVYTTHSVVTDSSYVVANDTNKVTPLAATDKVISIPATSALSLAIQPKTAATEVKKADVVKGVQDAIDAQLKADGVDQNGVKVTVEAVNKVNSKNVDDGHTASAVDVNGEWTLLVKQSIANDFYKVSDGTTEDGNKTTDIYYVVKLATNGLKETKATAVALADKTEYLTGGYWTTSDNTTTVAKIDNTDATIVKFAATLTPADANTATSWKVVNSDGDDVTSSVVVAADKTHTKVFTPTYNDAGALSALKEADLGLKANEVALLVTKPGTYTVTATNNDNEASATLTIRSNFKDVPATAYYANAVVNAYKLGITKGISDSQFGVNETVTRAQFITWLYNYAVSQDKEAAIKDADVKQVFSDVPTTAYYAKAVQWASQNKYAAGTGDGKFSPNAAVTRAQAVTFIYNVAGKPATEAEGKEDEKTTQFTDVNRNAYYMPALTWGTPRVVSGLSTTTFGPDKTATRAQGISFIARAFGFYN